MVDAPLSRLEAELLELLFEFSTLVPTEDFGILPVLLLLDEEDDEPAEELLATKPLAGYTKLKTASLTPEVNLPPD